MPSAGGLSCRALLIFGKEFFLYVQTLFLPLLRRLRFLPPPHRGGRFGILTFFLLLISSGFLAARLLTTGVLTQKLTLLLLSVLAGLNVLFAVTQLPRWRNKLWKLVLGVVALVLSAGMIYATVATNAVLETLSRVSSTGSVKTVVVRVRENDSAQEIGDTFGYTYGYLAQTDTDTTDALLTHLEDGTGAGQGQVLRHSHGSGRRICTTGK